MVVHIRLNQTYSVQSNDFEAEMFSSGYVLFQALLQAFNASNESETIQFDFWLSELYNKIPWLNKKVKEDFDFTASTYFINKSKRHFVYEWYHMAPGYNVLELELDENGFNLIYSVYGEDFDVGFTSGWDTFDGYQNIINTRMPLLSDYEKDDIFDFNSMIDQAVYDADGKCVFLKQMGIKKLKDVTIIKRLGEGNDNSILDDYQLVEIRSDLRAKAKALGFN
jgi:hypothetical protein